MRTCDISLIAALFAYFSKVHMSRIFFRTNWHFRRQCQLLFVLLLPISIRFRYLDHLFANRMAPSVCDWTPVERDGVVGFKQFCTIFPHFRRTLGVYVVRVFFSQTGLMHGRPTLVGFLKCQVKLACLVDILTPVLTAVCCSLANSACFKHSFTPYTVDNYQ